MINVVIINAQKDDREKISEILAAQEDFKAMANGKDGYDALKLIGSLKPDIAILDNHLEFIEGEELPPLLKARSPLTQVIILTSKISDYQLYRAAANEVSGFIDKEKELEILPGIIKCVHGGGCYISPLFAARFLRLFFMMNRKNMEGFLPAERQRIKRAAEPNQEITFPCREDPTKFLSKSELRILTFVGEGHTSTQIAENLDLATGTVRNYISAVMHKTGLRNRSQMARYAYYYGLVPLTKP